MILIFEEQELAKSNKKEPRIEKTIITRNSDILYVSSMSIFAAREAETDKDVLWYSIAFDFRSEFSLTDKSYGTMTLFLDLT